MTPTEVEEHMRLLWHNEWRILSLVYSAQVLPSARGSQGGAAGPAGGGSRLLAEAEAKSAYKMFFLRVLPVAPNKFRPPSKVGEEL